MCCLHIETSQLIWTVNQLTGFNMRATLAFNGLTSKILYIRQNIIMPVLRKASFYSVEIWWLTKINNVKEDQGGKLIQTLIQSAQEVLRGRNMVYIIELFLHQKT